MEDLHKTNLKNFYQESTNKAKNLLKKKYSATQIDESDNDFPNIVNPKKYIFFQIHIEKNEYPLNLIIAIPKHFPDEFPKIYLSKENYSELGQIPHIDSNRFVCTKDPNVTFLNDSVPEEALDELIRVAIDIINKGIKKENLNDFTEEFLAYWNEQAKYKFLALLDPSPKIEIVKILLFAKELNIANIKRNGLITKNKEEYEKWMKTLDLPIDQSNIFDALYLPLSEPIPFPLPQKNRDVFKLIRESGNSNFKALKNYMSKGNGLKVILFSFPIKHERILAGWISALWRGKTMKGFRKGQIPIELRMSKSAMLPIDKISIERVDQERLFIRGGLGIKSSLKKSSLAIVGCGSLGSPLAISLSKCGISSFLLVDNDILEPANVARHVCGISDAIKTPYKSEALCKMMLKQFPHIDCQSSKEDILDLLEKNEMYLDKYDMSIIAIGNKSVERRLNYLTKKGVIGSPLILVWMEPFGVAGHLFYLCPANGGCFQCCFDSEGNFVYSVAKYNKDFFKRESGCQSTYIPYSNLEIDSFINSVTREVLFCLEKKPKQSYLMTWLGNLSFFNSLGYQINDIWAADLNYSIHRKEIKKNNYCELCKAK